MCDCDDPTTSSSGAEGPSRRKTIAAPAIPPAVPLASTLDLTPNPEGPFPGPGIPFPFPTPGPGPEIPLPIPQIHPCRLDFRDGCYALSFRPNASLVSFQGTLRVDRSTPEGGADKIIVSGDLYRRPLLTLPILQPIGAVPADEEAIERPVAARSIAAAASDLTPAAIELPVIRPQIPIYPRASYHSYLKVTSVSIPRFAFGNAPCHVTLVAEQFDYTQPATGQFLGSFPTAPSRTVTLRLTPVPAPFPFSLTGGPHYQGRWLEGGVDKGSVSLAWVSRFFRRATVEIDTLAGAVRPEPVPDGNGGSEFFDTIFARTGWQLSVVQDQTDVPVPQGIVPTNCWSLGNLHNLMVSTRKPSTDLDKEWRIHLMVVPAKLGCSRGVMYDQIGVPREGCASFCDDGYPTSDSLNFGVAANRKQRDVPRAFLRSATHEVTHTLNQIHQEQETSADNSIMTTTPSVADVLGDATTGEPGVFPDQIHLGHNATVRNHLNHMPDPVIRPGGWPFGSWFPSGAPQAGDRQLFDSAELTIELQCASDRVALGQPVELAWTLTNRSDAPLRAPNDVSVEALFATVTVGDAFGREKVVRPFAIVCDHAKLAPLEPGQAVAASMNVFWSSNGFAFERPGRYTLTVAVQWSAQGLPVGVQASVDVFVDYPTSDADNHAAGLAMHPEVGKWVALGGDAYHLTEACRRLDALATLSAGDAEPPAARSFADLMPSRARMARLRPDLVSTAPAPRRRTAAKAKPVRKRPGKGRRR